MNTDKIWAEAIAKEYAPKDDSKVIALKKLDRKAKLPATVFAYSFGIVSSLVAGLGMCLAMQVIGEGTAMFEAKAYIAQRIGQEYIIPTLGIWDRFEEIDFEALPDQFVLKCTHDSGGLVIVRDKATLDKDAAKAKIEKSLKQNYYLHGREWPYKDVKPRIIAEKYMEDTANDALTDYKFFCFHGVPKIMYISKDRGNEPRTDFFDMDFNHLPIKVRDPNAEIMPAKPKQFEQMRKIAEQLSEGIPHLRVDFYLINERIYIGELTFFHMSGFTQIKPAEWNEKMGSWITLPTR